MKQIVSARKYNINQVGEPIMAILSHNSLLITLTKDLWDDTICPL